MCDPLEEDCSSSPRYFMDVMSQLWPLTVKVRGLAEPASTTMLSPLLVTPKAASANEESVAAATNELLNNMAAAMRANRSDRKKNESRDPGEGGITNAFPAYLFPAGNNSKGYSHRLNSNSALDAPKHSSFPPLRHLLATSCSRYSP